MNVYAGEGTSIASMFCLWIADTLIKFWLSISRCRKQTRMATIHKFNWRNFHLVIQTYEAPASGRTNLFRSLLNSQVTTGADRAFLYVPATQFLCRLRDQPTSTTLGKLVLSERDWLVFQKVAGSLPLRENLANVIKELDAATRRKEVISEYLTTV